MGGSAKAWKRQRLDTSEQGKFQSFSLESLHGFLRGTTSYA
jgi:hypothetical protein